MAERPTGVTILAILALIGGLFSLFFGGFETIFGPMVSQEAVKQTGDESTAAAGGLIAIMGIGFLIHGVIQLIVAFGLFTLKGWAWVLAVIAQVLSLVLNGLNLTGGQMTGPVVGILIAAGILYYLFRPHVKQAFGRG